MLEKKKNNLCTGLVVMCLSCFSNTPLQFSCCGIEICHCGRAMRDLDVLDLGKLYQDAYTSSSKRSAHPQSETTGC